MIITGWDLRASRDEQWSEAPLLILPDSLHWPTSARASQRTYPIYLTNGIFSLFHTSGIVLWVAVCNTPCYLCFCLFLTIL